MQAEISKREQDLLSAQVGVSILTLTVLNTNDGFKHF